MRQCNEGEFLKLETISSLRFLRQNRFSCDEKEDEENSKKKRTRSTYVVQGIIHDAVGFAITRETRGEDRRMLVTRSHLTHTVSHRYRCIPIAIRSRFPMAVTSRSRVVIGKFVEKLVNDIRAATRSPVLAKLFVTRDVFRVKQRYTGKVKRVLRSDNAAGSYVIRSASTLVEP